MKTRKMNRWKNRYILSELLGRYFGIVGTMQTWHLVVVFFAKIGLKPSDCHVYQMINNGKSGKCINAGGKTH